LTAVLMPKRVIDISAYWPKDESGKPYTVNRVWTDETLNPRKIGRYTLQKALAGELGGGEIDTIDALIATCSEWSGRTLKYEDILADAP